MVGAAKARETKAANSPDVEKRIAILRKNPLAAEVYDLLLKRISQWKEIAGKTEYSYSWISKFMNGHIANSSYGRLVALRDWLTAHSATT